MKLEDYWNGILKPQHTFTRSVTPDRDTQKSGKAKKKLTLGEQFLLDFVSCFAAVLWGFLLPIGVYAVFSETFSAWPDLAAFVLLLSALLGGVFGWFSVRNYFGKHYD